MHIEQEVKLDFSDVIIRPKRSTLASRNDVDLFREIVMPHNAGNIMNYIPVINANMGTSGTFEIAEALLQQGCLATVHKHYSFEDWKNFLDDTKVSVQNLFFPVGMKLEDLVTLQKLNSHYYEHNAYNMIRCIMIDVANGYSQKFIDHVAQVRKAFPNYIIAAGNVVTAEMTEALIIAGADIVKCGVGSGSVCTTRLKAGVGYPQLSSVIECLEPSTLINMKEGKKKEISKIKLGDEVLTHKRRYKKVIRIFEKETSEKLIKINGTASTRNHEYYVVHKKFKNILTDENIHDYAEWVSAEDLSEDFLLIKNEKDCSSK